MWTVAIADEHVRKSCVQCLPVEREKGQNEKKNMLNMVKHGDIKLTKLTGLWLAPVIVQFVIIRLNGLIWWNRWNHQKTNATYQIYKFLRWQRWCAATCSPFFLPIEIPKAHASTHLHYISGHGIWLCAATIKVGQFVSPSVIFPLIFSGPALDPITNPWVFFFVATTTFISHSILGSLLMRLTNIYLLHSYGRLKIIQALKLCKYLKFDSFSFSISFPFWCVFFLLRLYLVPTFVGVSICHFQHNFRIVLRLFK